MEGTVVMRDCSDTGGMIEQYIKDNGIRFLIVGERSYKQEKGEN